MNYAIIAAGDGSRLVSEGISTPKPLINLDGRPMILRLISIFMALKAETISIIINEHMTQVQEYLHLLQTCLPCDINVVVKSTPSSMHSFMEVSKIFPEGSKFILTTVDTIFNAEEFAEYVKAFEEAGPEVDGIMGVTTYIEDEKPLYVGVDGSDRITGYFDEPFDGVRYISAGVYGLTTKALDVLDDCIDLGMSRMRNYQRALVKAGMNLRAYDLGLVLDVDHAHDIEVAKAFLEN